MAYVTVADIQSLFRKVIIKAATGDTATDTAVTIEEVADPSLVMVS